MDAVLTEGLHKSFGEVHAVAGVDLRLPARQVLGIVGPDGAGKTTLIRLLVGVLAPDRGRVALMGHDALADRAAARGLIGYMSQAFSLYEDLTVQENIRFFARLRKVPATLRDQRAGRLLEATRLAPFIHRPAGKLSGGMKQKLGLICTLIHEPKVLFLDEPTNGVDPVSRREFWEIVDELRSDIAIVVSTPALEEAERCDQVALMSGGKILAHGTPDALRASLDVPVWELEVARPFQAAAVLGQTLSEDAVQLFGDRVHVAGDTDAEALTALLAAAGHQSVVRRIEPSLEDAYVRLITRGQR
ncbi:MAG: ABC transporter ATP-binding protein [Deltaproteobacteria bacterium]|nr:ABC transporter ATP-binding protein [Deltaproteobacteria bacterium]